MSWDIFAFDLPKDASSVRDISRDYRPAPLGDRGDLKRRIAGAFPRVRFSDDSWGSIDAGAFSIEISLGSVDPLVSVAFHVRGDDGELVRDAAGGVIAEILEKLNLRAIDSRTGEFFNTPMFGV
jgi:hypothetical protein